ncbi:MAG: hypothetical protein ACE5F5_10245 [Acidimicrobiia bacterium]
MEDQAANPKRASGWLIPGVIALATVLLVVIALVREPAKLDPDTPEGTVQEYLLAVSEERWEDAFAVLDPEFFVGCDAADLARNAPREPFTAVLRRGDQRGLARPAPPNDAEFGPQGPKADAFVEVEIRFGDPGPFSSGYSDYAFFELTEEDGFWWITNDPWPYFAWSCAEGMQG